MSAAGSGGSTGPAKASSSSAPQPTSTELMIALSHIQQLIPLLDYKPGGLSHILPSLLVPLAPLPSVSADPLAMSMGLPGLSQSAQHETIKRYRGSVEHAFQLAQQLHFRVQDPNSAGGALELANKLMQNSDRSNRILRVRRKRRLLADHEKALDGSQVYAPPPPPQPQVPPASSQAANSNLAPGSAADTSTAQSHPASSSDQQPKPPQTSILPSLHPDFAAAHTSQIPPPDSPENVRTYLGALQAYFASTPELVPVPLDSLRVRLASFTESGFTLELHVLPLIKALVDATVTHHPSSIVLEEGDEKNRSGTETGIEISNLQIVAFTESIEANTPSRFPVFRSLSVSLLDRIRKDLIQRPSGHIAPPVSLSTQQTSQWQAYLPITEAVARVVLGAAEFRS
ncbi:hypothetical protein BCV70DRAFT_198010 [Testicularia cyperi]|uniref:Uncharacterized protein n=1 Tax=Testicularia cyperi TaxID=1882483 RepID=A0A317Y2L8_9BASI|nr:hypothetical protein BCV70DRAFT_198010 [Testicularia cyperi]